MNKIDILINQIAQNQIDFEIGCKTILTNQNFDFQKVFIHLRNYIFNSIPNKIDYNSETYQKAIEIEDDNYNRKHLTKMLNGIFQLW